MKRVYSYNWLQSYFDEELPPMEDLVNKLLKHSFEVEHSSIGKSDSIIELDILANRGDCLGHYGIAREIGCIYNRPLIDDPYKNNSKVEFEKANSEIEISTDNCERYTITKIVNCTELIEPNYIKERLKSIDQKLISPFINLSNYILYDLGQPSHIFDAAKVSGKFSVCEAAGGEEFTALNDKLIKCSKGDILIKDKINGKILCLAGIIGAKSCEVTSSTKNVYVEVATFAKSQIRHTLRKLNFTTDAGLLFSQGIEAQEIPYNTKRLTEMIMEVTGGSVEYYMEVSNFTLTANRKIGMSVKDFKKLMGFEIEERKFFWILKQLNFEYKIIEDPVDEFLNLAKSLIGAPYKFGASVLKDSPNHFDCSSFISYCAFMSGLSIPRISINQCLYLDEIKKADAVAGDIIFFKKTTDSASKLYKESIFEEGFPIVAGRFEKGINHVGIFIDNKTILHSNSGDEGGAVVLENNIENEKIEAVAYRRIFNSKSNRLVIEIPFYRHDIFHSCDVIEEIARINGYNNVPMSINSNEIRKNPKVVVDKIIKYQYLITKALNDINFSEVMTYAFQKDGDVFVIDGVAKDKEALRINLSYGLAKALSLNIHNADLLGLDKIAIFEFGNIHPKSGETVNFAIAVGSVAGHKKINYEEISNQLMQKFKELNINIEIKFKDGIFEINFSQLVSTLPNFNELSLLPQIPKFAYKAFSKYPFVSRDISILVPKDIKSENIEKIIFDNAAKLLEKLTLFDIYKKDNSVSYAYRLAFQSHNKTLDKILVNKILNSITIELEKNTGWRVR